MLVWKHACLKKKCALKVLQLFIYGRMIRLIGVRDIILEEWCDWIIFGLWREWSDHTHQLWLSVELNKPSKPGYVNSAMYLAKKVKIKNKYKSYSATWVLIWNVIFGSFCTNFATWMTPFLYQFCILKSVTPGFEDIWIAIGIHLIWMIWSTSQ